MKLWLDSNIQLDLSREAIEAVEVALRHYAASADDSRVELQNASNIIRAHLQHVLVEPAPTDQELLA